MRRVEKSKQSIKEQWGIFARRKGKILKNNKRDSSFIRVMRIVWMPYPKSKYWMASNGGSEYEKKVHIN